MPPESWIVSEPYAGLQAQALGLAEAAGLRPGMIEVRARAPYRWLPARFWPDPLAAIDLREKSVTGIVFSTGGTGGAVGAALRRRGATALVQVQNPRMELRRFDLVVANRHDEITGPNVVVVRTALHRASPARLEAARAEWAPRLAHLKRPLVAVLVGGSNGRHRLEAAEGAALARSLHAMMRQDGVGVMVTPSRRTEPAVRDTLRQSLEPLGAWIWDFSGENPYFGMLACADVIVATIDSISMMSEAAATTAPLLLAELPGRSRRISLFTRSLTEAGRARPFAGRMEHWPVEPVDDTAMAANEVRTRLGF